MAYDNTNTGSMFVNDRKETENHPDRTGGACIECPNCGTKTDFWQSGWLKTSKAGKKFLSQSFKPKDAPTGHKPAREPGSDDDKGYTKRAEAFDDDENLPF